MRGRPEGVMVPHGLSAASEGAEAGAGAWAGAAAARGIFSRSRSTRLGPVSSTSHVSSSFSSNTCTVD